MIETSQRKFTYACLYINMYKDPELVHSFALCQYLVQSGLKIVLDASDRATITAIEQALLAKFAKTETKTVQFLQFQLEKPAALTGLGFYIAVGGDGTFLEAVHHALRWQLPLVGFKLGRLGFLAAMTEQNYNLKLEELLHGKFVISKRLLLACRIESKDGEIRNYTVFNDLVLNRKNISRIAKFILQIDGTLVDVVPADGMILATPSGSTAYALAAGGAIIDPSADVLEISPICPHSLHNRSYVAVSSSQVIVEFPEDQLEELCVFVDGKSVPDLKVTDKLTVTKAAEYSEILTFPNDSFVANLEQKLKNH